MATKLTASEAKKRESTLTGSLANNVLGGITPNAVLAAKKQAKTVFNKYDTSTYDNAMAAYEQKAKADMETSKQETNAQYDSQAKQAYISKMQNQRQLQNNLIQQGIRGGSSETSQLKQQSSYENTRNTIAANRQSALRSIEKETSDNIFNYNQEQNAAKQAYIQQREAEERQIAETKRQEAAQVKEQKRQEAAQVKENKRQEAVQAKQTAKTNKVQEYVATIGRYNTVKKADAAIKAIKKLKKSNPKKYAKEKWKIKYIQAQKAEVQNKKKK